jgi:hypothetical protein
MAVSRTVTTSPLFSGIAPVGSVMSPVCAWLILTG